jgi:hypothetical protein
MSSKTRAALMCWMILSGSMSVFGAGAILESSFELSGERSSQEQYYRMETKLKSYSPDGKRVGTDIFRFGLKCVPASKSGKKWDEYTCLSFTVQMNGNKEVHVPALEWWSYFYDAGTEGLDDQGQVLGIDHAKFEKISGSDGEVFEPATGYHVYNAFIDFHSFCNVFAEDVSSGKGIGDLKKIGDKIVHAAAFSEAPVNVGSRVVEGSTFTNGEITMEFKGLSIVDGSQCGLVEFDSGASSFLMLIEPMPDMKVRTVGSSHYMGDIYVDLETNWVRRVAMDEFVVCETTVPMLSDKIYSIIERHIDVRNVDEKDITGK